MTAVSRTHHIFNLLTARFKNIEMHATTLFSDCRLFCTSVVFGSNVLTPRFFSLQVTACRKNEPRSKRQAFSLASTKRWSQRKKENRKASRFVCFVDWRIKTRILRTKHRRKKCSYCFSFLLKYEHWAVCGEYLNLSNAPSFYRLTAVESA